MNFLSDVRNAIADALADANVATAINVFAYRPNDFPLPAVLIFSDSAEYVIPHETFGPNRMMTVNLIARVVVPLAGSVQSGEEFMDELLSSSTADTLSISDAIESADYSVVGLRGMNVIALSITAPEVGVLNGREDTPALSSDINLKIRLQRA